MLYSSLAQRTVAIVLVFWCVWFFDPAHGQTSNFDDNFQAGFHYGGLDGAVNAIVNYQDQVVVGGDFQSADSVDLNHVAYYHKGTSTYSPLAAGVDGIVSAMVVYQDQLLVLAGSTVRAWNGTTWTTVGEALPQNVGTMVVVGDDLYSGPFRLEDGHWQAAFSINGNIGCQIVWRDLLICGGSFDEVDGATANGIMAWDGGVATMFGDGFNGDVHALCVQDDILYAGGEFSYSGQTNIEGLGRWNGSEWLATNVDLHPMASPMVRALTSFQGRLIAEVHYSSSEFSNVVLECQEETDSWRTIASLGKNRAHAFCPSADEILIGGLFEGIAGTASAALIRYDGAAFTGTSVLGKGLSNSATTLCVFDDELYVGGKFDFAGDTSSPAISTYDGQQWQSISLPTAGSTDFTGVEFTTLTAGETEMSFRFQYADGYGDDAKWGIWDGNNSRFPWPYGVEEVQPSFNAFNCLFPYNQDHAYYQLAPGDDQWIQMDGDFSGGLVDFVFSAGQFVVGGSFCEIGGLQTNNIACWMGPNEYPQWSPLGDGLPGPVTLISEFNNRIVVVYRLEDTSYISLWDNTTWRPLGQGLHGDILCLTQYGPHLYAGGSFSAIGSRPANSLAWWNGKNWFPYGHGIRANDSPGQVSAMQIYDEKLYIAGCFDTAGYQRADNIACINAPLSATTSADNSQIQTRPVIYQNVPNPFNPLTNIAFTLPQDGQIILAVYDLQGHLVQTLAAGVFNAGDHQRSWDGRNASGQDMPSGVYLTRLTGTWGQTSRKITLAR